LPELWYIFPFVAQTKTFLAALLGYTVLVLLLFHGLFGRFSTAVPHDLGDPLLSTSILWWNAHHLPFTAQWWDGPSFFPEHGSLAFSDHRVGLGLVATPIQWLGGTAVLAYNVTLLSSFVFAALAAHALAWTVSRSHVAGAVSGLVFGFNPFRISHIAHLELLVVCWLPLALVALHLYVRRDDIRWLGAFAVLWGLQGLSSGYYLFYSAPVIGLWTLWFARARPWASLAQVAAACASVFVVLSPLLLHYRLVQNRLHLERALGEIQFYSADATGLLSATPIMALWRLPSLAANGETEIYIGIVAPLLLLVGLLWHARRPAPAVAPLGPAWRAVRLVLAVVAAGCALAAAGTLVAPWSLQLGPISLSVSQPDRPLGVAVWALLLLGATAGWFRTAVQRGSPLAFYTVAAGLTWLLTLGPKPTFLGTPFVYRGPYALLMLLPGFDTRLRVPARFVMLTILAVGVAAGIVLPQLMAPLSRRLRVAIVVAVLAGIIADSWTFACPIVTAPSLAELPAGVPVNAAVLELPLGETGADIAAAYRGIGYGRPVVNGYSGYDPPHYRALKAALEMRDDSVLTTLATFAPLAVIVRQDDPARTQEAFVAHHAGAIHLGLADGKAVYLLPSVPRPLAATDPALPVLALTSNMRGFDLAATGDGNLDTRWVSPKPQTGGEEIVVELREPSAVSGVSLSTGEAVDGYPLGMAVTTSLDGVSWGPAWEGDMGGGQVAAVLAAATAAENTVRFPPRPARFVKLRQLRAHPTIAWVIAEMKVRGTRLPR
jgi:hypothetical protein